jgi:hypothetical protein
VASVAEALKSQRNAYACSGVAAITCSIKNHNQWFD